jgi:hypothetical protein
MLAAQPQGMMIGCVSSSAVSDLHPACWLACLVRPLIGVKEGRTAGATARGRRAAPTKPKPRLDWADRAVLAALIRRQLVLGGLTKTGAFSNGKVTGGTGSFNGATGSITAKNPNKAGTRTAVTITYSR